MKVKIKKDVKNNYLPYLDEDYELEYILDNISGKVLEVDTEYLFQNEFNLKPIPGLTNEVMRVFIEDIDEIIDDARKGKAHCELCGETSDSLNVCTNCGHSDYLEPLIEDEY